jgi:hypothetical protein
MLGRRTQLGGGGRTEVRVVERQQLRQRPQRPRRRRQRPPRRRVQLVAAAAAADCVCIYVGVCARFEGVRRVRRARMCERARG